MVGCTSHFDMLLKKFLMYLGEFQVVYRQESRRTNEEKLIKYFIPSSGEVLLGPSEEERN